MEKREKATGKNDRVATGLGNYVDNRTTDPHSLEEPTKKRDVGGEVSGGKNFGIDE